MMMMMVVVIDLLTYLPLSSLLSLVSPRAGPGQVHRYSPRHFWLATIYISESKISLTHYYIVRYVLIPTSICMHK